MKSNKKFLLLSAIIVCLFFQSCTIAKISGKGAVPILLNQPSDRMELIEHIVVTKNINFDYTSSFDVSQLLANMISEKKITPDAVINTTITIKSSLDNSCINIFTLGFAQSRKFVVEADLMRYKK
ncbi:MAG: hypothetical protein RJA07_779 [Bacteroidota bacterium]|jgi:hypothetical protein